MLARVMLVAVDIILAGDHTGWEMSPDWRKNAPRKAGLQRVRLPGSGRQGCKSRKVEVLLPSIA